MSELKERRWAVLSERGCEEAGLSYEEAAAAIARLRGERVSGLCVITGDAASRLPQSPRPRRNPKPRRTKKKSAS